MRAKASVEFSHCFQHLLSSAGVAHYWGTAGEGDEAELRLTGKRHLGLAQSLPSLSSHDGICALKKPQRPNRGQVMGMLTPNLFSSFHSPGPKQLLSAPLCIAAGV